MLDSKRPSDERLKSRNAELPWRSTLRMRRGGERRSLRGVQSPYREGKVDLLEEPQVRRSPRRLAMCRWVGKAQEADHEEWALERGAPRLALVGASGPEEDEEQGLDFDTSAFSVIPRGPGGPSILLASGNANI